MAARATVSYTAEIRDLRKQLAEIPDVTAAEARKIAAEMNKSIRAVERAQNRAAKAAKKSATSLTDMRYAASAVAAEVAGIGYAFVRFNQAVADSVNELHDMATRTGVSAETLAGFQLAAEGSGQQLADLNSALQSFPKRLADFSRGAGDARYALEELGYRSDDADAMLADMDGTVRDVVSRLQAVDEPGRRAALAVQLFGRSGGNLIQALSGTELEVFVAQAREFGIDVGPAAARAADQWQPAMSELSAVARGAGQDIATAWAGPGGPAEIIRGVNVGIIFAAEGISGMLDVVMTQINDVATVIQGLVTGDFAAVRRVWQEISSGQRADFVSVWIDAAHAADEYMASIEGVASTIGTAGSAIGARFAEDAAAASKAAAAERARAAALEKLLGIQQQAAMSVLDGEERIRAEYEAQVAQIAELEAAAEDHAAAEAARAAVQIETERQLQALRRAEAEEQARREQAMAVARQRAMDSLMASARATADGMEALYEEGSAAATAFYLVSQSVAAAGAIISGLRASVAALEPPPIGLGPVAGMPLAAAAEAFGFAQAGVIAAQTVMTVADTPGPVTMPGGGIVVAPGDTVIAGRRPEDIQRQAAQLPGRREASPVVVIDAYRGWDRWGPDALRSPGPWRELRRMGRRIPGRRGDA